MNCERMAKHGPGKQAYGDAIHPSAVEAGAEPRLVPEEIEKKKDGGPGTFDEFLRDIVDGIRRRMRGHGEEIHRRVSVTEAT